MIVMKVSENQKNGIDDEGDIRKERDPKPASQDIEEGDEMEKKEGNLPPAMPPGA
jgi:hypothetical protein